MFVCVAFLMYRVCKAPVNHPILRLIYIHTYVDRVMCVAICMCRYAFVLVCDMYCYVRMLMCDCVSLLYVLLILMCKATLPHREIEEI